jgi:hypothetical protein
MMGARIGFLGWVPYQGFGTPLFSYHCNVIGHIRGPGPASLLKSYGQRKRSIKFGVPFGNGATIASAFVARWCAAQRVEIVDGVYRVRDDQPTSRVGASLHKTP